MSSNTIRRGEETIHLEDGITVEFEGYYLHNKPYYGKIKKYKNNELIMEGGFTCLDGNPTYDERNYNGEITEYKNGNILHKGTYRYQDVGIVLPKGKHVYYHDNGKVKRIEPYNKHGELDGDVKQYDRNGNTLFAGKFVNGRGTGTIYDNSFGPFFADIIYKGEVRISEGSRSYIRDMFTFTADDICLSGDGKEYDYNGRVVFEGTYSNGRRFHGKEYDDNGRLVFEGVYDDNLRKHGTEYDHNGRLVFEGAYDNGRRFHGKEYDANGRLVFEGDYFFGGTQYQDGCRYIYNSEGKLIQTEIIENLMVKQRNDINNENKIHLGSQNQNQGLGKK